MGWTRICTMCLVLIAACVKTGTLKETTPLQGNLSAYEAMVVEVTAAKPEHEKHAKNLQMVIVQAFQGQKLYGSVSDPTTPPAGKSLKLAVIVDGVDEGSDVKRAMNMGGEAEIAVRVDVLDSQENRKLTSMEVKGNSKRKSTTTINGVDTSWGDNLTNRAYLATADQLVQYFKSRKK
jgi:hypothetical protein